MASTTINPSDQTITQYNIQTGGASNLLNNVAPSATSGVPVISQGASSQPVFGTVVIAGGGTNATSMSTSTGIVKYDGTSLVTSTTAKIDSSNRLLNSSQPAFFAYLNSSATNATGDGTAYTVAFGNELFDQGSNFASNTFTAPVAGVYYFSSTVGFSSLGAGHTTAEIDLVTSSAGSFRLYFGAGIGNASGSAILLMNGAIAINMAASETATIVATVFNSTKTVTVSGSSNPYNTWFSGYLVC